MGTLAWAQRPLNTASSFALSLAVLPAVFLNGSVAQGAIKAIEAQDQFERDHRLDRLLGVGTVVLLSGNQRNTEDHLKEWSVALAKALPPTAKRIGLVDLDRVPFFVPNSAIRSSLKESLPSIPVLCDWDGEAYKALRLPDGDAAVSVYRDGKLLGRVKGTYTGARLEEVKALIPG